MADDISIGRLGAGDLSAYKSLRDDMLARYPEAFTSDAPTEARRGAENYRARFGLAGPAGAHLTLGAHGDRGHLLGAISVERDLRPKVQHIGHLVGMMVSEPARGRGIGRALLEALFDAVDDAVELLTLTVTEGNATAIGLYERAGFRTFGRLDKAVCVGGRYHAKLHMVKDL